MTIEREQLTMKCEMKNQQGQIVLILILVMTVALAIGLSVIQRSLSDVSTSTKVEQSTRAFSAAEAGIEKAIQKKGGIGTPFDLGNNSSIERVDKVDIPGDVALEYLPISKEELAQVWLANPGDLSQVYTGCTAPGVCYLGIYWGDEGNTDHPAIEVTVIYDASGVYKSKKYYLDRDAAVRGNGFDPVVNCPSSPIVTSLNSSPKTFYCSKNIPVDSGTLPGISKLIMVRARLLYAVVSHSFAVKPVTGSLPVQASIYTSTGSSGGTQRRIQVLRLDKVVPFYFDYAIFSVGDINK